MLKGNTIPLAEGHFPLLLKWLEAPHVKAWWDPKTCWNLALIQEKYASYVKGYKLDKGQSKPIYCFIICVDEQPVGYIQIYNAYDFSRNAPLEGLPPLLAAFDMFIGEDAFLGQGIGSAALKRFLGNQRPLEYTHVFANPERNNLRAIRSYEKAGFKTLKNNFTTNEIWMLKDCLQ